MRHPMKLKDITIRPLYDYECGLQTMGMNYAAQYHSWTLYYSEKPTKHHARDELYKYIIHNIAK